MKKKKLKIIAGIILTLFSLLLILFFIYIGNISIYEPGSIKIDGVNNHETKHIKIISISPLYKKNLIPYDTSLNKWFLPEKSYHKTISFTIPDSIISKIKSLNIEIADKKYSISAKELIKLKHEGNSEYKLPDYICRNNSISKKIKAIILRPSVLPFVNLLLLPTIFILLIYCIIKFRKGKYINEKTIKWCKIIGVSLLTPLCLFYGYLLVKYTISSLPTAILFIILCGILLSFFVKIIVSLFHVPHHYSQTIKKSILVLAIVWLFLEILFRVNGFHHSYNEERGLFYVSGSRNYSSIDKQYPHLLINPKNFSFFCKSKEYNYEIKTNSEGLRDIDHTTCKAENEYRIICLGNSFTEGYGTPQDSTWPRLLENRLAPLVKKKLSVFNAGKAGSDPFFEYMLLAEKLLRYDPDLVLFCVGSDDFNFYRLRGGFERFTKDGFHYRKPSSWEKLYAISYVFRFVSNSIFEYNFLLSKSDYKADSIKANRDIEDCVDRFYQLSIKEKFNLGIVFIDDRNGERYNFLKKKLKKENLVPIIDLIEYNKEVEKLSDINLKEYYWPIDGHCNSRGYNLMAKGVLWNLDKLGILDSINKN